MNLLKLRGFAAYLLIVFLNAFVDLGHKIVIQNTVFKIYDGQQQIILTAIVNALILIPFVLLMSPAGYCSDRFAKHRVMQLTALIAVVLTLLITLFYHLGWFWPAFIMTFMLAVQSALYSPAKYGYIRELVGDAELARANGFVQATTTVAILAGIFLFSVLFEHLLEGVDFNTRSDILMQLKPIGYCLVFISLIELMFAFYLPNKQVRTAPPPQFNLYSYIRCKYLATNLGSIRQHPLIPRAIFGLAIFWSISQVMLAAFPAYTKETMAVTNTVVIQGMLACAGIGIVIGSVIAGTLSRRQLTVQLVPVGAVGITVCLTLLPILANTFGLSLLFLLWGVMGGFVIIPLNTLIQQHAVPAQLGRILSANNLIQNCFMLSFLVLTVLSALLGMKSLWLIILLQLVATGGTLLALFAFRLAGTR